MLVLLSALLAVGLFLYNHFTKYNNYWKDRNIAGPEPTFLFGNIKDLIFERKPTIVIYKEICDRYPDEKIVGIFRMRTPDLLVKDLEIIKHIMIKDFDNFTDRDVDSIEDGLGANLFHANGDTWRALRHSFSPIFTSGKLKNMMHLITERGDKLVEYVDTITRLEPEQDVHEIVKKYTQATIVACAFGLDMDTFNDSYGILEVLEQKIFNQNLRFVLEMMYTGILKRMRASLFPRKVCDVFSGLAKTVIAQRNGEPSVRNDFMDLMLALRKAKHISVPMKEHDDTETSLELTDDIIAGQMFSFYSAGYQTTATTMAFMLHYLALNPDIQDKVIAEIEQVLQRYEGKLTYQAVLDLKFMGQVFDETLRLHPVVDTLRRRACSDYRVPGTDLIVQKGQIFIVPIHAIHMDPNIFANPEVFDPERFSPENVASRPSCSFLPFGVGSRHCIGMRFAKVQSCVCLARLLSAYRVEPTMQTPKQFHYEPGRSVLYPRGGFPLKLVRRQ